MLAFVDESGDAGLKFGQGSSDCFTVAVVIFEDREQALACNGAINRLRTELGFDSRQEFKFNKCSRPVRERFLSVVAAFRFRYHAVVLNKVKLADPVARQRESLYYYPIRLVFENAKTQLDGATVFFDTTGSREFVKQLGTYLKKRMTDADGRCRIKKVKAERSHSNNLIQLADMVCGAVSRSFKPDKADHRVYREIVKGREELVQFWPT
jgi:hypothetical protein